jgi:hypothetical protein
MAFSPLPPLLFFFLLVFFLVLHPSSSSLSSPIMSFTSVQLRGVQGSSYKRELLCDWSQSGDAAMAEIASTVLLWNAISVEQLSRGKRRCLLASSGGRRFE